MCPDCGHDMLDLREIVRCEVWCDCNAEVVKKGLLVTHHCYECNFKDEFIFIPKDGSWEGLKRAKQRRTYLFNLFMERVRGRRAGKVLLEEE